MLAARRDVIAAKLPQIQAALAAVHEAAILFREETETIPKEVAQRYQLKEADAQEWYKCRFDFSRVETNASFSGSSVISRHCDVSVAVDIRAERHISQAALEQAIEALKVSRS